MSDKEILRESIIGSRTLSNFLLTSVLILSGLSFFLVGISSYFQKQFFPFTDTKQIIFVPQGLLMVFYGSLGCIIGTYIFLNILWDIGSGYNEFSKKDALIRIVRRGFPGKNGLIFLSYSLDSVKKIKVIFKQGLNPRNNIILVLRDKREIPLYPSQNYRNITDVETKAISLSEFLDVPLENESQFN
jgi:hypothetical protein